MSPSPKNLPRPLLQSEEDRAFYLLQVREVLVKMGYDPTSRLIQLIDETLDKRRP